METLAFGILLFGVYFTIGCYLIFNPDSVELVSTSTEMIAAPKNDSPPIATVQIDPWDAKPTAEDANLKEAKPKSKSVALLEGINPETISLRSARKVCRELKISQKVNGKDAPLSWLRSQIHKQLEERPQEVHSVILKVLKAA